MPRKPSSIQVYWRARGFPAARPAAFAEGEYPRWWDWLERHVQDGATLAALAGEARVSRQVVYIVLRRAHKRLVGAMSGEEGA